jgi:hypothetical protein
MIITKEMREHFQKRMKTHIDRVNYFAKKLTLSFPEHDADKFLPENIDIQTKFSWSCFINRSLDGKEAEELDRVTLIHITTQQHHPEYWVDDKSLLEGFTRHIPTMGLDCSKMSNVAIYEMCCDWCAMAKQFHSHPKNWADKTVNKRWMFTDEQVTLIYDTLKFLSNGEEY